MQKVITVEHVQKTGTFKAAEKRVTEYAEVSRLISEGWRAVEITSTSSHQVGVCYITIDNGKSIILNGCPQSHPR